jgi:hypothetical protein
MAKPLRERNYERILRAEPRGSVMAICRCMILAFQGDENDDYTAADLREGIAYAEDLLRDRRCKFCPLYHYDLRAFVSWASAILESA